MPVTGAGLALVAAALVAVAFHLAWVVPRLGPTSAGSVAIALALACGGASLWVTSGFLLPLTALVFGHLGWWLRGVRTVGTDIDRGVAHDERPAVPALPPKEPLRRVDVRSTPERTTLGRYRIERELGRGAMGAVYLGLDPQIGRQVAIKTMALGREFAGTELVEARARFFREAEMAGRLRHPDIVTIFDASEEQGLAFIAMEYVKGHDLLRHTLPGALLPVPMVLRTLARVAQALAHAHSQGVVHRDVKPANVMIEPESGSVKVTDFGIARITDACRTRTGLVLGTPSFMSPEQMAGRRVDGRSDLYSLGVMLFQMLTGALPHRSESMAELMNQIANDVAPDVRTLRPDLPEALANVVALALEKRVEVRYADGNQFAADLLEVAQMLDSQAVEPPAPGVTETPDSGGFAATAEFSRVDPRHNADH
jgi:eukaryotic-like serine/threonine-protein kinase